MVKIVVALARKSQALGLELTGAGSVIYGASQIRPWAAWLVAGIALLAKSLEVDMRTNEERNP